MDSSGRLRLSELLKCHKQASHHKEALKVSEVSCFYCLKKYSPKEIKEWCDKGQTAICPKCGIDSVLPGNWGTQALQDMHDYWFTRGKTIVMRDGKRAGSPVKAVVLESEDSKVDLNELCRKAHRYACEKGFWDETPEQPGLMTNIGAKIALIHAEVSEALEEYRNGHPTDEVRIEDGKPEGLGVELADVIIRTCDLAEKAGVNLGALVKLKMRYNETRPMRHGGKKLG